MKMLIALCCLLAGCAMTPAQKKYTAIGISILAVGAVAAHDHGNKADPGAIGPGPGCAPQPDGSCR